MIEQAWSTDGYRAVAQLVQAASGLAYGASRRAEAEYRIRAAMLQVGMTDLIQYGSLLESDPAALDELVSGLSVGETYFFRDPQHFAFVRSTVLPAIRRARGDQHVVRAWSAGCSTGEEAYSLAILLEQEGLAQHSAILATDISRPALQRAAAARYRAWAMRGVDGATRERYFCYEPGRAAGAKDDEFVLVERIRDRVSCAYLNLTCPAAPTLQARIEETDLIFCRNVLIYFDGPTIEAVLRRLVDALAEGGWLILGPSDPVPHGDLGLETYSTPQGLFYCRRTAAQGSLRAPREPDARRLLPARHAAVRLRDARAPQLALAAPEPSGLLAAEAALLSGDYARAIALASGLPDESRACAVHARALANVDLAAAERLCSQAALRHAFSAEMHHLHAALFIGLGRYDEAARAAERVVYLDRTLAAGHFLLASIRLRRGEREAARRSYRNAQALCAALPGDQIVPLCDGASAAQMAEWAASALRQLDGAGGGG